MCDNMLVLDLYPTVEYILYQCASYYYSDSVLYHFDQSGSHGSWASFYCQKVMEVTEVLAKCRNR